MAEPINIDDLEASAPKKGAVNIDSLEAPAKPAAISIDSLDEGFPVSQGAPAAAIPIEDQALQAATDIIPQGVKDTGRALGEYVSGSPVGDLLRGLNKPMELASAGIVKGLDATVMPGIKDKLNPDDVFFPRVAYHDIINEAMPPNQSAEGLAKKFGLSGWGSDAVRLGYATTKAGVGLAADLLLDPLNAVSFGTLTAASKAARAGGNLAKAERNLVEMGAFGRSVEVPLSAIPGASKAAKKAGAFLERVQDIAGLDYRTGDPLLDVDITVHNGLGRGQFQDMRETFVDPVRKMKLTPEENYLLADIIEKTPNKTTIEEVRKVGAKLAGENKIGLSSSRLDQVSEAAMMIKQQNEADLAERLWNRLLPTKGNVENLVMENYLSHQISPTAKAYIKKNPKMAMAIEESVQEKAVNQVVSNTFLNTFDRGKFGRSIRTTLNEANKIMKEKTGVTDWFIADPIAATAIKRLETKRLVRDKNLIDSVRSRGKTRAEARAAGLDNWVPMPVPNGSKAADELAGYVFEPKLADRFSYYITPQPRGHIAAFFDSYNRVFRTVALAKPDYFLQNYGENMVKNWAVGVKIDDYRDALKLATGKGDISIKSPGGATQKISAQEVKRLVREYGIDSGGQFLEGVEGLLYTGKKLYSTNKAVRGYEKAADRVESVFKGVREFGEKGENYTRRALFINRLKQGYKPEIAALDVEKFLFDFTRNGKGTNFLRRYFDPFIQAAIKTGQTAPELLGQSPGKYNFLHNNLLNSLEAAFQDPGTAAEVKLILPEYRRFQDPIVGPMLPGNGYIAEMFANRSPNAPRALGGRSYVLFKLPIGMDILNRFALWDAQALRMSATGSSPIFKSMIIAMTGKDPFTGKDLDMAREVDVARRASAAIENAAISFMPMPNTWNWLKGKFGITTPEYVTPAAAAMFHGSFGKFAQVTNLDREYAFRLMTFAAREKALAMELTSRARAEAQGRTGDLQAAGTALEGLVGAKNSAFSSQRVRNEQMQNGLEAKIVRMSGEGIQGYMSAAEIAQEIKNTHKRIKELNESYATNMAVRLNFLKNAKKEEAQGVSPESFEKDGRSPQSIDPDVQADWDEEDELMNKPRGKTDQDEDKIRTNLENMRDVNRDSNSGWDNPEQYRKWEEARREREAKAKTARRSSRNE